MDASIVAPEYKKLADVTAAEVEAARAYAADSGLFHLAYQGGHDMVLTAFCEYQKFLVSGKTADVASATQKFALTNEATLFSGYGNGVAALGGFSQNDTARFVGMTWRYPGIISTTVDRRRAEDFADARVTGSKVLMTFRLPSDCRLLPMREFELSHEMEFILPANQTFKIDEASRDGLFLRLSLSPHGV